MTSLLLRKLNAYPEFRDKDMIKDVIKFVLSNSDNPKYPNNIKTTRQEQRYMEKFGNDFKVVNGLLYYIPSSRIKIRVIFPEEKEKVLQEIHDDIEKGQGVGLKAFYAQVTQNYIGITRTETNLFLKSQANYTITRDYKKRNYNKPVLSKTPNERWSFDIIDMTNYTRDDIEKYHNNNGKHKYILTMVDFFSNYFFARPLETKSMNIIEQELEDIITEPVEKGGSGSLTGPKILQSDGALEFVNLPKSFLERFKIKSFIITKPYLSTSNALIEKMNSTLRRKIRAGFVKNNDLEWSKYLQSYVKNMNNQRLSRGKYTPNELWKKGYNPSKGDIEDTKLTDKSSKEDIIKNHQNVLRKRAKDQTKKQNKPSKVFFQGDKVRISLLSLDNEMMKRHYKTDTGKLSSVKFTPDIFTIVNVYDDDKFAKSDDRIEDYNKNALKENDIQGAPNKKRWATRRQKYTLKDSKSKIILRNTKPRYFYGNELQLVLNTKIPEISSNKRVKQINRFTKYEYLQDTDKLQQDNLFQEEQISKDNARKTQLKNKNLKDREVVEKRNLEERGGEEQYLTDTRKQKSDEMIKKGIDPTERRLRVPAKPKLQKRAPKEPKKTKAPKKSTKTDEIESDSVLEPTITRTGRQVRPKKIFGEGFNYSYIPYVYMTNDDA